MSRIDRRLEGVEMPRGEPAPGPAEHAQILRAMYRHGLEASDVENIAAVVLAINALDPIDPIPALERLAGYCRTIAADKRFAADQTQLANLRGGALRAAITALQPPTPNDDRTTPDD